jgi:hypothetical protein
VGAPPAYADAVALLVTMTDDQFPADVPPHWGVTFGVDDADATVAMKASSAAWSAVICRVDEGSFVSVSRCRSGSP